MTCQVLWKKNNWLGSICSFLILAFVTSAQANSIPKEIAVRIIVGEASDQGLKGMICIGEVLRHRGSIKGFYGYKASWLRNEPRSVWVKADKAWEVSAHTNYTKGADHFENIRRFGAPWWVKYCVKTYEYRNHVFYKEIRRRKH